MKTAIKSLNLHRIFYCIYDGYGFHFIGVNAKEEYIKETNSLYALKITNFDEAKKVLKEVRTKFPNDYWEICQICEYQVLTLKEMKLDE